MYSRASAVRIFKACEVALSPSKVLLKGASSGAIRLQCVSSSDEAAEQFSFTWDVMSTHCTLTARELKELHVQFPVGQLYGGSGSEMAFGARTPLYIADFTL